VQIYLRNLFSNVAKRRCQIHKRWQYEVEKKLTTFYKSLDSILSFAISATSGDNR